MRNKTIISTAAFIIAFVFSAAFASLFIDKPDYQLNGSFKCQPPVHFKHQNTWTADKIGDILEQDATNACTRDRKLFQIDNQLRLPFADSLLAEYADDISEYAEQSGSIDTGNVPQEFQSAWSEHMKAWRNYADFLDRLKNPSARMKMNNEKFAALERNYDSEISRTWYEVLDAADEYGVTFR